MFSKGYTYMKQFIGPIAEHTYFCHGFEGRCGRIATSKYTNDVQTEAVHMCSTCMYRYSVKNRVLNPYSTHIVETNSSWLEALAFAVDGF